MYLGLESVRSLIKKVAAEMKKHIPTADIYPTVYSLCAIHAARNAGIFTANHRSLVVQWAKTGNDEDNTLKLKQMQESKMTENQINHMLAASENVTYIGLAATQNLITNFEVVSYFIIMMK